MEDEAEQQVDSSRSSLLGRTAAAATGSATATTRLETTTRSLSTHTSTAARSTAATSEGRELLGARAALLDLELNSVDGVRVGGDSGLVGGRSLEVDKGAVLSSKLDGSFYLQIQGFIYLSAADVEVLNLAKLGQRSPQRTLLNLAVDVLDVGALLVGVGSGSGVLGAGLLLLVSGGGLPAGSFALASGRGLVASGRGRLGGGGGSGLGGGGRLGLRWGLLTSGCGDNGRHHLVGGSRKAGPGARDGGLGHSDGSSLGRGRGRCRGRLLGLLDLSGDLDRGLGLLGGFGSRGGRLDSLGGLLNLGGLLSWRIGDSLCGRFLLCDLLELVVDLGQVLIAARELGRLLLGSGGSGGRLLDAIGSGLELLLLLGLLGQVAEDVVEDKVSVGLLGKDKGLDEALVGLAVVGDFSNDLDDNVRIGALRVDVGDADLGVLEVEVLDALVYGLEKSMGLRVRAD